MTDPELGYSIDAEGFYVSATPGMLDLLGYSADEFRGLPVGTATGQPEDFARREWRDFIALGVQPPPGDPELLRARDGRRVPVILLGVHAEDGHFVLRYALAGPDEDPLSQQHETERLLRAWRASERRLAAMTVDDPGRTEAQRERDRRHRAYLVAVERERVEPG